MRVFACCLLEGTVSVVVIAACDCVMLLLESVMLFIVLYSLLEFVLWSSVWRCFFQFSVCCSCILLVICVFSACICTTVSCVWGVGECFSVSRCLMRP